MVAAIVLAAACLCALSVAHSTGARRAVAPDEEDSPPLEEEEEQPEIEVQSIESEPGPGSEPEPASKPQHEEYPDRLPADRLGKWRKYARARHCPLEDRDYQQIFNDLWPYREAGGISGTAVAAARRSLPDLTGVLTIRDGKVVVDKSVPPGLPFGGLGWYKQQAADFAADLPDMKLLISFHDLPRSWVAPLPAAVETALADGSMDPEQAWLQHACDAVGLNKAKPLHGVFSRGRDAGSEAFWAARGPIPILSGSKIPRCFSDILVPRKWPSSQARENRASLHSGCPISSMPWDEKADSAAWRGSSSGAQVDASMPAETWQLFQRQRLVNLSRQYPDHLDAAFTRYVQCDKASCAAMKEQYGAAVKRSAAQLYSHKAVVVVDGNGASSRLGAALCSGSVPLVGQLFREWFFSRLVPHRHYLPLHNYDNLPSKVEWIREHDKEARQVAAAASQYVNHKLRAEDHKCYMYRLFLEYSDIYRDDEEEGGGDGGGVTAAAEQTEAATAEQQAAEQA